MNEHCIPSCSVCDRGDREPPRRLVAGGLLRAAPGLAIASCLIAACAQAPAESQRASSVITLDRLETGTIIANRTNANKLTTQALADAQSNVTAAAGPLLATDDGRELFSFLVSCALPSDAMLVATVDGNEFDFFGDIGLAPQWRSGPLDVAGQHWVSACLFARVNADELAIPISMRGPNLGLAADDDERAVFTLEEGAFFGNMFGAADEPVHWFACRGRDQAAGDTGELADRECAEPDPAKPSLTRCGFVYTGDCGTFAPNPACESFSSRGTYYQRCHTTPVGSNQGDIFTEVITTFVSP